MASGYPPHPLAGVFPMMAGAEYEAFKEDVRQHGLREPIVLHDGKILDGRNREKVCAELGISGSYVHYDGPTDPVSLVAYVRSRNQFRRHLTPGQVAMSIALERELLEQLGIEARQRQKEAGSHGRTGGRPPKNPSGNISRRVSEDAKSSTKKPSPRDHQKEKQGRTRDQAADSHGVSGRHVDSARKVAEKNPELAQKVLAGEVSLPQAVRDVQREEKRQDLEAKAAEAKNHSEGDVWQLHALDWLEGLTRHVPSQPAPDAPDRFGEVRLAFLDPPYNIGIDYGNGAQADLREDGQYLMEMQQCIFHVCQRLTRDGSLWFLIGDEYAAPIGCILKEEGLTIRNWIKWYEGFGVNCPTKFNRTSRHLFWCVRDPKHFVFHAEAVTRPSDRQTKYNDARADPAGKTLDDVWFDIPRLAGTHAERIPDFPTQLPVALLRRVVLCATDPGDLVLDPFAGSATTGAACIATGRRFVGFERNERYAELARCRLVQVAEAKKKEEAGQ